MKKRKYDFAFIEKVAVGAMVIILLFLGWIDISPRFDKFNPEEDVCDEWDEWHKGDPQKMVYAYPSPNAPVDSNRNLKCDKREDVVYKDEIVGFDCMKCLKWHPKTPCEKGDEGYVSENIMVGYNCKSELWNEYVSIGYDETGKYSKAWNKYLHIYSYDEWMDCSFESKNFGKVSCVEALYKFDAERFANLNGTCEKEYKSICRKKSDCELNPREDVDCLCKKWDSNYVFSCDRWDNDTKSILSYDCNEKCGADEKCLSYCNGYVQEKYLGYLVSKHSCEATFERTKYCIKAEERK